MCDLMSCVSNEGSWSRPGCAHFMAPTFSMRETILGSRAGQTELIHRVSDDVQEDKERANNSLIHRATCCDAAQYVVLIDLHHLGRLRCRPKLGVLLSGDEGWRAWLT